MKHLVRCLALFLILLLLTLQYPFLLKAQSQKSQLLEIPLQQDLWKSNGKLSFSSNPDTQENFLDWKPSKKNAFLRCELPQGNLSRFNQIRIKGEQLSDTQAWFFVYLHDQRQQFALSFFQLKSSGIIELELSYQMLFSAFSYSQDFDWSHVQSISFVSHPSADLNIEQTHLRIYKIEACLHRPVGEIPSVNLPFPVSGQEPLFFKSHHADMLKKLSDQNHQELYRNAIARLNQSLNQVQLQDMPSLESLRDSAIHSKFIDENPEMIQRIIQKTLNYHRNYWKKLHEKNDILVQEEALSFIQIFDMLKKEIMEHSAYEDFFLSTLIYIAKLEKETCIYWIQRYPYGHGNNHVTRAACILGIIALVYPRDQQMRQEWLDFCLMVLDYFIRFQITPEGVLNEGTHYYAYLMETLSYFTYFLFHATGHNLFYDFAFSERLRNLVRWSHQIETPEGYLPCIDDSWPNQVGFPKKFLQFFFHPSEQGYSWHHTRQPWNLMKGSYFPLFLIYMENILNNLPESSSLPAHQVFKSDSQAVFRDHHPTKSQYLFLAGKNVFSLHEHDNAGSFQYFWENLPIITVSGYGPEGWTSHQRSYYVSGQAHNTVMVNGSGPKGFYNGGIGPIDPTSLQTWFSHNNTSYAHMNISWGVQYPDIHHQRHYLLYPSTEFEKGYLMLMDTIASSSHKSFQVNLHPVGSIFYQEAKDIYYIQNERHEPLATKIQQITRWKRDIKKGFRSAYWGQEIETDYLQFSIKEKQACFAALIQANAKPLDTVSSISHESMNSAQFFTISANQQAPFIHEMIMLNPYLMLQQAKDLGSNANFVHLRYNHNEMKIAHCYMQNGAYLNHGSKGLFYARERLSLSLVWDENQQAYLFKYDSPVPDTRIFFYMDQVSEIIWQEESHPFDILPDRISFILPQGDHSMIIRLTDA